MATTRRVAGRNRLRRVHGERRGALGPVPVVVLAVCLALAAGCGSPSRTSERATTTTPATSPSDPTGGDPPPPDATTTLTTPDTTVATLVSPGTLSCSASNLLTTLDLRQKLAQLLMVGIPAGTRAQLDNAVSVQQVGGVLVASGQTAFVDSKAFVGIRTPTGIPVLVGADEEGGRVQRVKSLAPMPSARRMAASMTPEQVEQLAFEHGTSLRALGITMPFAPVVDVSDQPDNTVIGDRSFSADPDTVIRYAGAFARGYRRAGMIPVLKHFPGHGRASGDTHKAAATTPPLDELRKLDLVPYRALLTEQPTGVMVAHLDVPGLTSAGVPTSISKPTITDLLRGQLGFQGVVLTDDLGGMNAITSRLSLADAVQASLAAGADLALWVSGEDVSGVLDQLEAAVGSGKLPQATVDAAVTRVLTAKQSLDPTLGCR